jgi:hypothetical protein
MKSYDESFAYRQHFWASILAGLIAGEILVGLNMVVVQPFTGYLPILRLKICLQRGSLMRMIRSAITVNLFFSALLLHSNRACGRRAGRSSSKRIPHWWNEIKPTQGSLMIAGIAWFVLYVLPTVKYPPVEVENRALQQRVKVASPSPEELFASGAAGTYQSLLAGYGAVSGLAALGIAFGSQKIKRKRKDV